MPPTCATWMRSMPMYASSTRRSRSSTPCRLECSTYHVNREREIAMNALRTLLIVAALVAALPLHAQESFPSRPVRVIVGYTAGGSTDIAARIYSAKMSEGLGQAVVVENHGGAAGT